MKNYVRNEWATFSGLVLIMLMLSANSFAQPVLDLKFKDGTGTNAADSSGNALDGAISGTPTWSTNPPFVTLDGTNQVTVLDNNLLDIPTMFSISFWIQTSSANGGLLAKQAASDFSYKFTLSAGNVQFDISSSATTWDYQVASTGLTLNDNQWHHVGAMYDGFDMYLYIDGRPEGQFTISDTINTSAGDLTIGFDGASNISANFGNVQIHNMAFGSGYFANQYNRGAPMFGRPFYHPLVAIWPFNEGSGSIANDTTPNALNASIAGGPTWQSNPFALNFTAVQNLSVTDNNLLDFQGEVSLMAWINTGSSNMSVIAKSDAATQMSYQLMIDGTGYPVFNISSAGSSFDYSITSSMPVNDNQWHLITGTMDGSVMKIYVDDQLAGQVAAATPIFSGTANLEIASEAGGMNYSGSIAKPRVFYAGIDSQLVAAVFGNEGVQYGVIDPTVVDWLMVEGSGTIVGDSTGNGFDATLTGGSWNVNPSIYFNGSSDYFSVSDHPKLDFLNKLSISTWINTTTGTGVIVDKTSAGNISYQLAVWSGNIRFQTSPDGSTIHDLSSFAMVNDGNWHHIFAEFSQGQKRIFIDGKLDTSMAWGGPIFNGTAPLTVGSANAGASDYYMGDIGRTVLIGDLSNSEDVISFFNENAADYGLNPLWPLGAEWMLNDGSGSIAFDNTGSGHDGTLSGAMNWINNPPAFDFTGGEQITVNDTDTFNHDAFYSLSTWFNTTSTNMTLMAKSDGASQRSYRVWVDGSGYLVFDISLDGSTWSNSVVSTNPYNDGLWHNVTVTYDGSQMYLYVDAIEEGYSASGGQTYIGTSDFYLGAENGTSWFNGQISRARFFFDALDSGMVADIFQTDGPIFGYGDPTIADYWFVENGGSTVGDSSYHGLDGTLSGGYSWNISPEYVNFSGSGSMQVPDAPELDFSSTLSLSAWIRTGAGAGTIMDKSAAGDFAYQLSLNGGNIDFNLSFDGSTWNTLTSSNFVNDNNWHHIMAVYDGTDMKLYIDGKIDISIAYSGSIYNSSAAFGLAASQNGSSNFYSGDIGHVKLYMTAEQEVDVINLYNSNAIYFGLPTVLPQVGFWPFTEATGGMAGDSSYHGNDATIYGGAIWNTIIPSIQFDGLDDYLDVPDNNSLDLGWEMGLAAWVKTNGNNMSILSKSMGGSENSYRLWIDGAGYPVFQISTNGVSWETGVTSSTMINDDQWHLVVGTFDGVDYKIYIDSIQTGINTATATIYMGTANLEIGSDAGSMLFNGAIGFPRVLPTAIDSQLVVDMFLQDAMVFGFGSGIPSSALYTFEEGTGTIVGDSSGNGQDANLINSPKWISNPPVIQLRGFDQYVNVTDNANLALSDSLVISATFRTFSDFGTILSKSTTSNYSYEISISSGTINFMLSSGGTSFDYSVSSIGTVNDGQWHHVIASYDGSNMYLYLDGALDNQTAFAGSSYLGTASLSIGGSLQGTSNFFYGQIGEVQLWNQILDSAQVMAEFATIAGEYPINIGTVAMDTSSSGYGGPAFTGQDSIIVGNFGLTNDAIENVSLDTIRVRLEIGDTSFIQSIHLFSDANDNYSYDPGSDTLIQTVNLNVTDSLATFGRGFSLDSIFTSQTKSFFIGVSLKPGLTFTQSDTLKFELGEQEVLMSGSISGTNPWVNGGYFVSEPIWGSMGSLSMSKVGGPHGGFAFTDQDTMVMMAVDLYAGPEETVVLDSMAFKMTTGNLAHIQEVLLFRDDNFDNMYTSGSDLLLDNKPIAGDSSVVFNLGVGDSIFPSSNMAYLLAVNLNPSPSFLPTDTIKFQLDPNEVFVHGHMSSSPLVPAGSILTSDSLFGAQGTVSMSKVGGPHGGFAFTDQDTMVMMAVDLNAGPEETVVLDSIAFKMTTGNLAHIQEVLLFRDDDFDNMYTSGSDLLLDNKPIAGDSSVVFNLGVGDSIFPSSNMAYLLAVNLNPSPFFLPTDTIKFQLDPNEVFVHGHMSSSPLVPAGSILTSDSLFGAQGSLSMNKVGGPQGGFAFTDQDSVVLMTIDFGAGPEETVIIDSLKIKMLMGDSTRVQNALLFRDINDDFNFTPGVDSLLDSKPVSYDSTVVFNIAGGEPINPSINQSYLIAVDLPATPTFFPSDTIKFQLNPNDVFTHGLNSMASIIVSGTTLVTDSIFGAQGSIALGAGSNNASFGGGVITDQDSVPILHFDLASGPEENIDLDSLDISLLTGDMSKIQELLLIQDSNNDGFYNSGTDVVLGNLSLAADSTVTFIGAPLDIITANTGNNYLVLVNFNAITQTTTDSYSFSINPANIYAQGAVSTIGLTTGGTTVNSNSLIGIDNIAPVALTGLGATVVSGTQIDLAWTASTDADADSIRVNYRTDGISPTSETDGTTFADLAGTDVSVSVTGLSEKTMYHFSLFVKDSSGNWGPAATVNDSTPDQTAPIALTGLGATVVSGTQIDLAWTASTDADADSIRVNYRTDGISPTSEVDGTTFADLAGTDVSVSVTGLTELTMYHFALFVKDSSGNWGPAATVNDSTPDQTAPIALTGLGATVVSGTQIDLAWTASTDADADSIRVNYRTDGISPTSETDGTTFADLAGTDVSVSVTGLTELTTYHFALFVKDSSGNWGPAATVNDSTPDQTAPVALTGLGATVVSGTQIDLAWTASTDADADSIRVNYRTDGISPTSETDGTTFADLAGTDVSVSVTGLTELTMYHFALFVKDSSGNWGPAATVNNSTPDNTAPVALSGLSSQNITGSQIEVSWSPSTDSDADSIRVNYRTDTYPSNETDGTIFANISAQDSSIIVTGLAETTRYYISLFVKDSSGNWGPMSGITDSTLDATSPVATVNAVSSSNNSPEITGTINDSSATINVYVSGQGPATATNNLNGTWTLAAGILSSLTDGFHTVTISVTDPSGNSFSDSLVNGLYIDATAPAITIDSLVTSDLSPQITGTIDDFSAGITLDIGGQTGISVTNNGDGTWTLLDNTLSALAEGVYNVIVTATDTMGNVGVDGTTNEIIIDATSPGVTISFLSTNSSSPQISGTVDDSLAIIQVMVDSQSVSANNNGDGTWSIDTGSITNLTEGTYDVSVTATDIYGNQGTDASINELVVDLTSPTITVNFLNSNDNTPAINGSINDPQASISISINGQVLTAINNGDGSWNLPDNIVSQLPDGIYNVIAQATDSVGNVGQDSSNNELQIVTSSPIITINEIHTNDRTPQLSGTISKTDASITVSLLGQSYTATNLGDGTWILPDNTIAGLDDGVYNLGVTATDSFGNSGTDSSLNEISIDGTAPIITVLAQVSDIPNPDIRGTINDSSAIIQIGLNGQTYSAVNSKDGNWILSGSNLPLLADGIYDIIAIATDTLGNQGTESTSQELTIDVNDKPVITNLPDTIDILEDEPYSFTLQTQDLDSSDIISLSIISSNHPWLSLADKELRGTAENSHVGINILKIQISDGSAMDTSETVVRVINVNDAPQFTERPSVLETNEDEAFIFSPVYSDVDDSLLTLSISGVNWLSIDSSNNITGQPVNENVGSHRLTITVSDGSLSDSLILDIIVINKNDSPFVVSSTLADPLNINWKEDRLDSFVINLEDPDLNDSLTLILDSLPDYLTLAKKEKVQKVSSFFFKVKPVQKDTGNFNLRLSFSDIEGITSNLNIAGRIEETNDAPKAVVSSHIIKNGAIQIILNVEDEDGLLRETSFNYSLLKDSAIVSQNTFQSAIANFYPLLDGKYSVRFKAVDKFGLSQPDSTILSFEIANVSKISLDSGKWIMAAVPMDSLSLDSLKSKAQFYHWLDNGAESKLYSKYQTKESLTKLRKAKGYWVLANSKIDLSLKEEKLIREKVSVKLVNGGLGWNQVSNPFVYPINLKSSGFTFYRWNSDSSDIEDVNGVLKPWEAYWVRVEKDTILTMDNVPYFGEAKLAKRLAKFSNSENWVGRMILKAGNLVDRENLFGLVPYENVSNHFEPPKMGSHISLFFTSSDKSTKNGKLSSQFTPVSTEEGENWFEFGIQKFETSQKTASLFLEGMDDLRASGKYIYLVDKNSATLVDESNTVTLKISSQEKYYSIVITSNENFAEKLGLGFSVSQNYPNPVRAYTNIKFTLPYSFNNNGKRINKALPLAIHLYNLKGQYYGTLFKSELNPGNHQFNWRRPMHIPNGAYVFTMEAPGFKSSKKMLLSR